MVPTTGWSLELLHVWLVVVAVAETASVDVIAIDVLATTSQIRITTKSCGRSTPVATSAEMLSADRHLPVIDAALVNIGCKRAPSRT
jgi:hypothetical protein